MSNSAPKVVLRYIGHLSPHGVMLPPPGVPARDLTQEDIDSLPMYYGNVVSVDAAGVFAFDQPARQLHAEDLLKLQPAVFEKIGLPVAKAKGE